jgi:hypothetical protein
MLHNMKSILRLICMECEDWKVSTVRAEEF